MKLQVRHIMCSSTRAAHVPFYDQYRGSSVCQVLPVPRSNLHAPAGSHSTFSPVPFTASRLSARRADKKHFHAPAAACVAVAAAVHQIGVICFWLLFLAPQKRQRNFEQS